MLNESNCFMLLNWLRLARCKSFFRFGGQSYQQMVVNSTSIPQLTILLRCDEKTGAPRQVPSRNTECNGQVKVGISLDRYGVVWHVVGSSMRLVTSVGWLGGPILHLCTRRAFLVFVDMLLHTTWLTLPYVPGGTYLGPPDGNRPCTQHGPAWELALSGPFVIMWTLPLQT
jgi:hypothetical protein